VHKLLTTFGVIAVMGFAVALSPQGAGAKADCNGTVSGTVNGGLDVHAGDACRVQNATIHGGIRMDGGTLAVCGSTVDGGVSVNVTGANSASSGVDIGDAEFGSNCPGNTIHGDISISGVQGRAPLPDEEPSSVEIDGCFCAPGTYGNFVSGSLNLTNNGVIEVETTSVTGSCQASGNAFVTSSGFPDKINGSISGQCASL
jgi:hypothetical protein